MILQLVNLTDATGDAQATCPFLAWNKYKLHLIIVQSTRMNLWNVWLQSLRVIYYMHFCSNRTLLTITFRLQLRRNTTSSHDPVWNRYSNRLGELLSPAAKTPFGVVCKNGWLTSRSPISGIFFKDSCSANRSLVCQFGPWARKDSVVVVPSSNSRWSYRCFHPRRVFRLHDYRP